MKWCHTRQGKNRSRTMLCSGAIPIVWERLGWTNWFVNIVKVLFHIAIDCIARFLGHAAKNSIPNGCSVWALTSRESERRAVFLLRGDGNKCSIRQPITPVDSSKWE